MSESTAILLFTRPASEEASHKRLFQRNGEKAFDHLIKHAERTLRKTGLPLFVHTEQVGGSFAERFTHAIQTVFDKGFGQVIAIGNDSPDLTTELVQRAQKSLTCRDLVIGKSRDGGAYLIGLRRKAFVSSEFQILPWQTDQLAQALCNAFCDHEVIDSVLRDIDTGQDFWRWFNHHDVRLDFLANAIKSLVFFNQPFQSTFLSFISLFQYRFVGLRAPPAA